jgi:hypothetical protein
MHIKIGESAFLLGMLIALIIGIFSSQLGDMQPTALGILAVLGFIVGFMNIREKEINSFLIASLALLLPTSALSEVTTNIGNILPAASVIVEPARGFLDALTVFVAPAAFVLAVKAIYNLARRRRPYPLG